MPATSFAKQVRILAKSVIFCYNISMRNRKLIIMFSLLAALVLIVVLTSVIFSVQHIDAYCYNYDDTELEQQVVSSTGLKKGKSIFVIKEDKVAAAVEQNTNYRVKVINIERKFPNRVVVNYVRITPYAYLKTDGGYSQFGSDLRVTEVTDGEPDNLIKVLAKGAAADAIGSAALEGEEGRVLEDVLVAYARIGYYNDIVEVIERIDLRIENKVFIKMRAGVSIEVIGMQDILSKIRLAMTAYVQKADWRTTGTIIVSGGKASYSQLDRYAAALENLPTVRQYS